MDEKALAISNTVGPQVPALHRHLAIEGLEDLTVSWPRKSGGRRASISSR
jgi:hypothetical protein